MALQFGVTLASSTGDTITLQVRRASGSRHARWRGAGFEPLGHSLFNAGGDDTRSVVATAFEVSRCQRAWQSASRYCWTLNFRL